MESTVTHGPENAIHRRLSTPELIRHGALRALWDQPQYRLRALRTRGLASLAERSRRPHVCPTQTPEEVVQALIEARERHPSWGAKNS